MDKEVALISQKLELIHLDFDTFESERKQGVQSQEHVKKITHMLEVVLWGELKSPIFFNFFTKKNLLEAFFHVSSQRPSPEEQIELIKTLTKLISNLKSSPHLHFIFSSPYFNRILLLEFDFLNEDVVFYYVHMLKCIVSLGGNMPLQLFCSSQRVFPLFQSICRFLTYKEKLVRITSLNSLLNLLKWKSDELLIRVVEYPLNKAFFEFFNHSFHSIVFKTSEKELMNRLKDFTDYLNDLLDIDSEVFQNLILNLFFSFFLFPLLNLTFGDFSCGLNIAQYLE